MSSQPGRSLSCRQLAAGEKVLLLLLLYFNVCCLWNSPGLTVLGQTACIWGGREKKHIISCIWRNTSLKLENVKLQSLCGAQRERRLKKFIGSVVRDASVQHFLCTFHSFKNGTLRIYKLLGSGDVFFVSLILFCSVLV